MVVVGLVSACGGRTGLSIDDQDADVADVDTCPGARCGSSCVDLRSDPEHCGACDRSCDGGLCADGRCVPCPPGHATCDGTCRDLGTDLGHCGGCGVGCERWQTCQAGRCDQAPLDVEWARVVTKADNDRYPAFAVDSAGEVYLAGLGIGVFDLGGGPSGVRDDATHYLVRYSKDGAYRWHRAFANGAGNVRWGLAVDSMIGLVGAVVQDGFVDFGGGVRGSGTCPGCAYLIVLGLAPDDGAYRWDWEATCDGYGVHPNYPGLAVVEDGGIAVAANAQGLLHLGGTEYDPGPISGPGDLAPFATLARPDGSTRWVRLLAPMTRAGGSVEAIPPADLLWLLSFQGELDLGEAVLRAEHETEMALVRYGPDGALVRAQRTNGGVYSVAARPDGSMIVTGAFSETLELDGRAIVDGTGGFVLSLDRAGEVEWVRVNQARLHAAIAADGSVILAGYFNGPLVFEERVIPGPEGSHDIVVASYDRAGNLRWAHGHPAPGLQQIQAVEVTADGGIFVMGTFDEPWQLGDFDLRPSPIPEATGYRDVYIARMRVGR